MKRYQPLKAIKDHTDEELKQWLRSGSRKENDTALRYLYQTYFGMIDHFIQKNSGNSEDAADVFQEGLIVLFNQVKAGQKEWNCTLKTYLYSICRNLWLNRLRKYKRETNLEETHEVAETQENELDGLIVNERSAIIKEVVQQLSQDCQDLLTYFYYERNSIKEIMEKMGISSEPVAKNKKSNCMKNLRQLVLSSTVYMAVLRS